MGSKIFLTGVPGVGKSTVLAKVIEELKRRGMKVGGMVTQEARQHNVRVGFKITDVLTGREGWLARVRQRVSPRVGKYAVDLEGLEGIGVQAIREALENPEVSVLAIDELGPMELFSSRFKDAVRQGIASGKTLIGTIHYRANDPLLREIRTTPDVKIITVTKENRSVLSRDIVEELMGKEDMVRR